MIYAVVFTSLCAIFFLIRLHMTRKQIKLITKQLNGYNQEHVNMKLDISLSNQDIEALAIEINRLIDSQSAANAHTYRVKQELMQAIASMSHDLRTPLTSMIGYMQFIENEALSAEKRREYLEITRSRALHLQKLINDFFALSMIDLEDDQPELEKVAIHALVQELLLEYYDRFQEAGREPVIYMEERDLAVIVDKTSCKRLIENILLNVLQHSSGDFSIRLERQGKQVVLEVRNGIKDQDNLRIEKVFDRFYTADESRYKNGGIGLSIVQSLMKQMDGEVAATIEGSEFTVRCKWLDAS